MSPSLRSSQVVEKVKSPFVLLFYPPSGDTAVVLNYRLFTSLPPPKFFPPFFFFSPPPCRNWIPTSLRSLAPLPQMKEIVPPFLLSAICGAVCASSSQKTEKAFSPPLPLFFFLLAASRKHNDLSFLPPFETHGLKRGTFSPYSCVPGGGSVSFSLGSLVFFFGSK